LHDQLICSQPVTRFFCADQHAQQILTEALPTFFYERAKVARQLHRSVQRALTLRLVHEPRHEHMRDLRGPFCESHAVRDRHAQHLTDHCGWQRLRQVADHIHLARVLRRVEHTLDERLHLGAKPLDRGRGKASAHQTPQPRVVRWVLHQHEAARNAALIDAGQPPIGRAHADLGVAQEAQHIRMPEDPIVTERRAMNRVFLSDPAQDRIRIVSQLLAALERVPAEPRIRRCCCDHPSSIAAHSRDLQACK
jgi:hypothetical protein